MPTPRRPVPRKVPRSRAGVAIRDAILEAAEMVLAEHGIEQLSTNVVAARAGVSVGSLYQYFPDKHAILVVLAQRLDTRAGQLIVQTILEGEHDELEVVLGRVVDVLIGQLGSLRTRRELQREVPTAWTDAAAASVDTQVRESVAQGLARRTDVRRGPPHIMTWIVSHAVEMVVESAVSGAPDLLASAEFRAELIQLAVRYLRA